MAEREKLIELKDVQITFGSGRKKFVAVDNVNFDIYKGETFSLVGESGSGKTTIGRAILRINPTSAGEILFKGRRINGRIDKELDKEVIRKCQMIFQDPMASLNERAKVDYIISEGLINFHLYKDEKEREEKVQRVLHEVGLLPEFASRFPHEFSGGQRQRIGIARALIMEPEFIVADEPISALDVSIRAQVLNLLNRLKKSRGLTDPAGLWTWEGYNYEEKLRMGAASGPGGQHAHSLQLHGGECGCHPHLAGGGQRGGVQRGGG